MGDMKQRIYIADDDKNIRELISSFLQNDGYDVVAFETGDELMAAFWDRPADLLILDVMMPGTDGLTVCKTVRSKSDVPIIILTAKDSELDYVQGISLGSDDYLTKPFRPTVLLMRVRALLRRVEIDSRKINSREPRVLRVGNLVFNAESNSISCSGSEMNLTQIELKTLAYMMGNPQKAYSREDLLLNVWGYESVVETRVTDETMRRIRRKLGQAQSTVHVQTIWGFGYKLSMDEA